MSMDFVVLLAGPDVNLLDAIKISDARLRDIGFTLGPAIVAAQYESIRGVFDETDLEFHNIRSVSQLESSIRMLSGMAIEYLHAKLGTIYVLFGSTKGKYLNIWIEVGDRTYRAAFKNGGAHVFYRAIEVIAESCQSTVGIGRLEFSRQPKSPSQLTRTIQAQPPHPGPADIGLYIIRNTPSARSLNDHIEGIPYGYLHSSEQYTIFASDGYNSWGCM